MSSVQSSTSSPSTDSASCLKARPIIAMPTILQLLSIYPILESLPTYLSHKDLLHVGLLCRASWTHVGSNAKLFSTLSSRTRCTGGVVECLGPQAIVHTCTVPRFQCCDQSDRRSLALPCEDCGKPICNVRQNPFDVASRVLTRRSDMSHGLPRQDVPIGRRTPDANCSQFGGRPTSSDLDATANP